MSTEEFISELEEQGVVDAEHLPGDVRGLLRQQKRKCMGHIVGLGNAIDGNQRRGARFRG